MIDSQNMSLTDLQLKSNRIGDAGAAGLGAGLAYVSFCLVGWTLNLRSKAAPPTFFWIDNDVFVCFVDLQSQLEVDFA